MFPADVFKVKFIEQNWDTAFCLVLCKDSSVHKWEIKQTEMNNFTFTQVHIGLALMQVQSKSFVNYCGEFIVMGNEPLYEAHFYTDGDRDTCKVKVVSTVDFSVREVTFVKPEPEEVKQQLPV